MANFYDEIEIEDFEFDSDDEIYYYPCPCGDNFQISKEELISGEEKATCPTCSLIIKVIYNKDDFRPISNQSEEEEDLVKGIKTLEVN